MHLVLRSSSRVVAALACWTVPRGGPRAPSCRGTFLSSTHTPVFSATADFFQSKQGKDYAFPNSSWSRDMMTQFNKYMEMSKDGTWEKLPSYRRFLDHKPELMCQEHMENRDTRMFLRNMDEEGKGFEYVMFLNPSEKRIICVFQPGPYLEGPSGFAHGGCITAILDTTLGACAMFVMGKVLTANLTINFRNPIPLGSVVLVESKVDKVEGRKTFLSGQVQSIDGKTLHTEATGLFIQFDYQKPPQ